MHNQERRDLSRVSYPKGWVGEGSKWDMLHVFHITVMPSVILCMFFRVIALSSWSWRHQWQVSTLKILQHQTDNGLLINISELPRTSHFSHCQSIFYVNLSLKERKHKHGISALGKQCFLSSSNATADHHEWTIVNDGQLVCPLSAAIFYPIYKLIPAAASNFYSLTE